METCLQRNYGSLIQSIGVSYCKVAAALLTATDAVHRCQGHVLLEISVSGSIPMLLPPLPTASSLHEGCEETRQQHKKQAGVHRKRLKRGTGVFRPKAAVMSACTTAWGRNWEQIKDGLFFLKNQKTGKQANFLIAGLCTPSHVFSHRHAQSFMCGATGCLRQWTESEN